MKRIILILGIVFTGFLVNAQKQDSTVIVDALRAHEVLLKAINTYQKTGSDTVLLKEYQDNLAKYVHIEQIKQEKPYIYTKEGKTYVKDMYDEKSTEKSEEASQQGYDAYIKSLRDVYLKK